MDLSGPTSDDEERRKDRDSSQVLEAPEITVYIEWRVTFDVCCP
jgi:hypothetical protein